MQSKADSSGQLNASDDSYSDDLAQDDQHATNIDPAATAAAAVVDPAQPATDPSEQCSPSNVQDHFNSMQEHVDHVLDPLLQAAAAGDLPVLQQLFAELGSSAHGADHRGWTALQQQRLARKKLLICW
jgi:hypothetical protein